VHCWDGEEGGATMITVRLSPEDLSRVRFAFSPFWETVASFRVLLDPGRHALHLPWVEQTRGKLGEIDLAPIYALVRPDGYIPAVLAPPPTTPLSAFEDEMARLSETPAATVIREIEYFKASGDSIGPDRERLLASYIALALPRGCHRPPLAAATRPLGG